MSIGERLRQERERLGFTQPAFAALAETTKKSQIDYEKDLTQPKAGYLAAIAKVGADIQYIVTGERSATVMQADEKVLLERYRTSGQALKDAALRVLLGGDAGAGFSQQVIHGDVGQRVEASSQFHGDLTFNVGGNKKQK